MSARTRSLFPEEASERHTLSILVDNEAGVLGRIVGLFSARGYNIESLTVADVTQDESVSRITIVTSGPRRVIDQIRAQLDKGIADMLAHDGPVFVNCMVEKHANCFPMIPSGASHVDMLLSPDQVAGKVTKSAEALV